MFFLVAFSQNRAHLADDAPQSAWAYDIYRSTKELLGQNILLEGGGCAVPLLAYMTAENITATFSSILPLPCVCPRVYMSGILVR